jgi:L-serine/L-threonine ammonia-lyase
MTPPSFECPLRPAFSHVESPWVTPDARTSRGRLQDVDLRHMPLHIETPLIESRELSAVARRLVWLKCEALQPPGSFKIRGIGHACEEYARRGARRFIASSGGNAGIAAAYAGRRLALPVTVVVPETTSELARKLIRQEGAELIVHGASWQEANALAQSMRTERDAFVHPFDDVLIWQGHASLVDEIARSGLRPDAIVLSVGGGGLYCGIVQGLRRNHWADVPIIAAGTEGANAFAESISSGQRVALERITSIATSLGAKQICEQAFAYGREHPTFAVVVSDGMAVRACARFLADHRLLVEPACGAALAVAYENAPALENFACVLIIVCGGATMSPEQLDRWCTASGATS